MTAASISFDANDSGFQAAHLYGPVHSLFHHAPPERRETPTLPTIVIPFGRDTDFVEPGTILDDIRRKFESQSRVALFGLGGVGKSQLAIEYAYRTREASQDTWVFWVHVSNAARFEESFREIADRVKIPGRNDPTANILQLVYEWLCDERKGKWVLILDNVDDARFLVEASSPSQEKQSTVLGSGNSRPLVEYLPHCSHGTILVTTRSHDAALELVEQRDIIVVGPMNSKDALTLFNKKLEGHNDQVTSTELVATLEYMPLAIVQAAAYIFQRLPRYSVKQYVEDFWKNDRKRSSLLNHAGERLRRDREAKNSIIITWQISARSGRIPETLLQRNKDEPDMRQDQNGSRDDRRAGVALDESDQDDDSMDSHSQSSISDDEFEKNIVTLRNYSFISANEDKNSFEMHALVQLATREWLKAYQQQEKWNYQFIKNLNAELPTREYENWATCQVLFPHTQAALAQKPANQDSLAEWATILCKAAWYAEVIGRWDKAEEMLMQALKVRRKLFGSDHNDTLNSMANLASIYQNQGRWEAAEELEVQVMATRKTKLGADHPDTLISMANLASTFWNQGRWEAAEKLEVQVMETSKTKLGADHPDTLTSMANLASTFWNQGRWEAAEKLEVQVMETRKKVLGAEHPNTLISMANLASTYRNQSQWGATEKLEVQVMETSKKILGAEHPDTLISMANLASTYRNQGRWETAEEVNEPDTASTELQSAFWSDQARSTEPSSLSQIAVDIGQVTDIGSPMTFYRYKPSANELKLDETDGDIQSLESVPGDIDSLAESSSAMMHYRQAAVKYIVKIFTDDLELLALYQEATHCMDEAKFVKNNRRLLKRLFLDLRNEGHGASQKLAVRFLRSRSKRTHISSEIHRLLIPSDHTIREKMNLMLKQEQGNLSLLDRFFRERDSIAQQTLTIASETSDGELFIQPQARNELSEESEDDDGDEDMSGKESETKINDILSKLEATGQFVISGGPFRLYKENLRRFIQPVHPAANLENHDGISARRAKENGLLELDHDINFSRGFISSVQDMCKRGIEHLAGYQLSWWPLKEPEDTLEPDHVRVYSMSFRGQRFYDDIPIPLAKSLFLKLSNALDSPSNCNGLFFGRKAVLLHNTTLMRLLLVHFSSNMDTAGQDGQAGQDYAMAGKLKKRDTLGTRGHTLPNTEPSYNSSNSQQGVVLQTTGGVNIKNKVSMHVSRSSKILRKRKPRKIVLDSAMIHTSDEEDGQDTPVLFLSVYTGLNESIARTIVPGTTDQATFQCLSEAYRSISPGWFRLKRVTGIKFFRFHSFLFKEKLNCHYIDLHRDKERYPEVGDPEFEDYRYRPQPWPSGTPYPSHEVWHYFMHPEDCGTSTELKEMLPTRFKGPIAPRSRAFGVHVEERYSALDIFSVASIMFLITLGTTIWFIPLWLKEHPGDLQNATIPTMVAFTVVGFFIQLVISLLIFRWTYF